MSETGPLEPLLQLVSGVLVTVAVLFLAGTARRRIRAAAPGQSAPASHVLVPAAAIAGLLLLTAAWPGMTSESRSPTGPSFGWILTWWLGLPLLCAGLAAFLGSTDPRVLRAVNAPTVGLLDDGPRS